MIPESISSSKTARHPFSETSKDSATQRLQSMEKRLAVLENTLLSHASLLEEKVGNRLDRIEGRFQDALDQSLEAAESADFDAASDILPFSPDPDSQRQLREEVGSADKAFEELSDTLVMTRDYLSRMQSRLSRLRVELDPS